MLLGVLGFFGFIIFLIMWFVSLVRKSGKAKRNIIISAICFVVFIVIAGTSGSPSEKEADNDNVNSSENNDNSKDNNSENLSNNNEENEEENKEDEFSEERVEAIKDFHDDIIPELDKLIANLEGTQQIEFANEHDMSETDKTIDKVEEINQDYRSKTGFEDRDEMSAEERKADNKKTYTVGDDQLVAEDIIFPYSDLSISVEDLVEDYNLIKEEYTEDNFDILEGVFQDLVEDRQKFKDAVKKIW